MPQEKFDRAAFSTCPMKQMNNFIRQNHAHLFQIKPTEPAYAGPEFIEATSGDFDGLENVKPVFIGETVGIDSFKENLDENGSVARSIPVQENIIDSNSFQTYVIPIASTDYEGLEKIDPRLVDRIWRLNNLYWVVNEDGVLQKFKLRPPQEYLLKNLHYKNIILKARQLGFTTFICIFLLDYALFNKNKQLGIIAQTKEDAAVIFRKVRIAWENFPKFIKERFKLDSDGDSASEYRFTNGSVVRVSMSLRSGTYQAVLITEFGKICARFPEKSDEIVTGTLPAVPANGLVFIESTAEGEQGHFYDFCVDAMEAQRMCRALTMKDYRFFFFPWYMNPANHVPGDSVPITADVNEYLNKMEKMLQVKFVQSQRNWYYLESRTQKTKMKQEHPSTPEEAFLVSGNKMFDGEVIDAQIMKYAEKPADVIGDFLIYRPYIKGHRYGLGADVSQGVRRDSSTIVVIDFDTGEIVLTYRSDSVDPVNFAYDIKKAAIMYGACIAAPEANNVGMTTCVTLNQIYPYIYTQVREGLLETTPTPSNKLGYLSTTATKPKYMYELSEGLESDEIKCLDRGILLEAKRFNKEDALKILPTDETTRHFDLLVAAGIAWQMRIHSSRGKADEEDVAKAEHNRSAAVRGRNNYR